MKVHDENSQTLGQLSQVNKVRSTRSSQRPVPWNWIGVCREYCVHSKGHSHAARQNSRQARKHTFPLAELGGGAEHGGIPAQTTQSVRICMKQKKKKKSVLLLHAVLQLYAERLHTWTSTMGSLGGFQKWLSDTARLHDQWLGVGVSRNDIRTHRTSQRISASCWDQFPVQ